MPSQWKVTEAYRRDKRHKINTFIFHRKEVRRWVFVLKRPVIIRCHVEPSPERSDADLKSKGLLSMMLLPLLTSGITPPEVFAAICREGGDSIGAALKELKPTGISGMHTGMKRQDHGYRVCHLRNASVRGRRQAQVCLYRIRQSHIRKTGYGYPGYGGTVYGKPRTIKY